MKNNTIHDRKKLHFMHIPKTGGTSLYTFLGHQFKFQDICPCVVVYPREPEPAAPDPPLPLSGLSDDEIRKYSVFMHHLGWIPRLFFSADEIETITFLRDPIERKLSQFSHLSRNFEQHSQSTKSFKSLNDWLLTPNPNGHTTTLFQARYFCADLYFTMDSFRDPTHKSRSLFGHKIETPPSELLQLAIERLHSCAFVGITEQYNVSFAQLCNQYSWRPPSTTPKLNTASKQIQRTDLTKKTLDRLMEITELDRILYQEAVKIFADRNRTRIAFDHKTWATRAQTILPASSKIQFDFEQAFVGENWHVRQNAPPNVFCWTSSATSTLIFSIKAQRNLLVSVYILQFLVPESRRQLTLTANSYPIRLFHYPNPDGGWIFKGVIPHQALRSDSTLLELVFSLPAVKRNIDVYPSTMDTREFGFSCKSVEIKPVSSVTWITRHIVPLQGTVANLKQQIAALNQRIAIDTSLQPLYIMLRPIKRLYKMIFIRN